MRKYFVIIGIVVIFLAGAAVFRLFVKTQPFFPSGIPASSPVIPAEAGIQTPPSPPLSKGRNGEVDPGSEAGMTPEETTMPKKTPTPAPKADSTFSPQASPVQTAVSSAPTPSPVPTPTPMPTPSREPKKFFVFIIDSQFQPGTLEIRVGDTVTWVNKDKDLLHWPASDPHPTHTALSGFDPLGDLGFEESFSYTFTAAGPVPYHDHSVAVVEGVATVKGTIVVAP